jgi:hypothetical protein
MSNSGSATSGNTGLSNSISGITCTVLFVASLTFSNGSRSEIKV